MVEEMLLSWLEGSDVGVGCEMGTAYQRLVRKLTIENLWLYVMSILKKEPLYGYEIGEKIGKNFGFKPGKVTCYMVLYKLKSEGLITTKTIPGNSGGPQRKYYIITPEGEKALEKAKRFLRKLYQEL